MLFPFLLVVVVLVKSLVLHLFTSLYISGKHPSVTMQPNSAVETSLRLSRAQSSEHWRLSSSDPMPEPFVSVAATQPKGEKFFLVSNER